jgi:autotransporter translocation and assembly factor TamB
MNDLKVKNQVITWEESQTRERMRLMTEKAKRLGKIESDNDAEQVEESMDEEEVVVTDLQEEAAEGVESLPDAEGGPLSPKLSKKVKKAVLISDDVDVQAHFMMMKRRKAIMEKKRLKKLRMKQKTSVTHIQKRVESVREEEEEEEE